MERLIASPTDFRALIAPALAAEDSLLAAWDGDRRYADARVALIRAAMRELAFAAPVRDRDDAMDALAAFVAAWEDAADGETFRLPCSSRTAQYIASAIRDL